MRGISSAGGSIKPDKAQSTMAKGIIRSLTVLLLIIAQIWWITYLIRVLEARHSWTGTMITYLAFVLCLYIYSRNLNAGMKLSWILLISAFPMVGACLYALAGRKNVTRTMRRRFLASESKYSRYKARDEQVLQALSDLHPRAAGRSRYLSMYVGCPVWQNTRVTYYSDAKDGFEAQMEAARKAVKFIFLEYLTIEDAACFKPMADLLIQKAREGVKVRVIYDDIGSVFVLDRDFVAQMKAEGVDCRVFNPMAPILNVFMNNRDHRKIMVVDGGVGFTGGYNIARQYFHITEPYGYWKDTGARLEGDAVRNLTTAFLVMWDAIGGEQEEKEDFFASGTDSGPSYHDGFVQPYADSPLDDERAGEEVYMDLLRSAERYCWFVTPYLVLTDEMELEMTSAAKRGVDVRIITPGIPDKKLVYKITRSYYRRLLEGKVRIYEYSPGFCHAKMCVSDDYAAVIGTINLDYRSLFLHFEDGVLMYDCSAVLQMKEDFLAMFEQSRRIEDPSFVSGNVLQKAGIGIARLFAPLI